MRRFFSSSLLAVALTACASTMSEPQAVSAPPPAVVAEPAPLSDLVAAVNVPYETFTLPNGLTTIVHTDRKAPIVGVTVYYRPPLPTHAFTRTDRWFATDCSRGAR